jgi:hypothetical protein
MVLRVRISTKRPLAQAKNILIRALPYGFCREYLLQIIDRYLECGDLHNGFSRSKKRRLQAAIITGNHHFNSKSKTLDFSRCCA